MEGWATIKNASKYADVSDRTMREWVNSGELKHSRLNRKTIRIKYTDIDEYLGKFQQKDESIDDLVDSIIDEIN